MRAHARSEETVPRLSMLLDGIMPLSEGPDPEIRGLALDNRRVEPGFVFFALPGHKVHGLDFSEAAVKQGAVAVLWEQGDEHAGDHLQMRLKHAGVAAFGVAGLARQIGPISAAFYGNPSARQRVIGVTGTDGKTSVTQFIAQALDCPEKPCGIIGTLGNGRLGQLTPTEYTTPSATDLQSTLASFATQGISQVVMEVSSHGLVQGRVVGVEFAGAVLTNLGRDHLDYHGDLAAYRQAKASLFEQPGLEFAVVNLDDALGRAIMADPQPGLEVWGYTLSYVPLEAGKILMGSQLVLQPGGLSMEVVTARGTARLETSLLGRFNAANLLAALGVLQALGVSLDQAVDSLGQIRAVPGRLETFTGPGRARVVVDYAHTPQALEAALVALREHCDGALWCVFGCGGERDRGKRRLMGGVAERLSNKVILTDDNPRSEDPAAIVQDILAGMECPDTVLVEHDRAQAIAQALARAALSDVVLVAGKGHEDYQIRGARRLPYSDRETVAEFLGVSRHG